MTKRTYCATRFQSGQHNRRLCFEGLKYSHGRALDPGAGSTMEHMAEQIVEVDLQPPM